jgi:hypothetical protein
VARKRERRQRVQREDLQLEHLVPRLSPLAVFEPRPVANPNHARGIRLRDVIDADQARDLDAGADLLSAFALGGIERALIVVDEPARQAPQTEAGLDPPAAKQNAARRLHDHRGHDLRVMPQDEVVVRTGFVHTALDLARHEHGAAVDAEVGHD